MIRASAIKNRFLDLAPALSCGGRFRLPVALSGPLAQRLSSAWTDYAALRLELSQDRVGVRLVVGKPKRVVPAPATRFLGRNYGYGNPLALSVEEAPSPSPCPRSSSPR